MNSDNLGDALSAITFANYFKYFVFLITSGYSIRRLKVDTNNLEKVPENQIWSMLNEAELEQKVDLLVELLDRHEKRDQNIEAASFAEQASLEAESCMSTTTIENLRYRQGLNLWRANQLDDAVMAFLAGVEKYSEPDAKIELSKNLWGLADSHLKLSNYDESIYYSQLCVDAALADSAFEIAGLGKFVQGKALYLADREEEAIEACLAARNYKRQEANTAAVYDIDDYIATIYRYLGEYKKAEDLLRNCLTLAEATSRNQSYANYRLGIVLMDLGQHEEARGHLEIARNFYHEEDDLGSLADCDMALSRTYLGQDHVETALKFTRSATSLWDALGNESGYLRGLERQSILLFTAEQFADAVAMNERVISTIDSSSSDDFLIAKGWAQLRKADDFVALEDWENVLNALIETDQFGLNSSHEGNLWYYSLRSRALYHLGKHEEAMGIADSGLALTNDSQVDRSTAYLYEIKARVSLEQNRPDKERHLAHAIALHLAFGDVDKAREMSEYFKPDFSIQDTKGDSIRGNEKPPLAEDSPR